MYQAAHSPSVRADKAGPDRRSQASALFVIGCEAKCPTWPGGPPI